MSEKVPLSSLHLANTTSRAWEDEARKQLARAEALSAHAAAMEVFLRSRTLDGEQTEWEVFCAAREDSRG